MLNKNIDLQDLPLTARLTASRPASKQYYQGKLLSPAEIAKLQSKSARGGSIDGLSQHEITQRLISARAGHSMPKAVAEPTTQSGFFDGTGFVILNDSIGVL